MAIDKKIAQTMNDDREAILEKLLSDVPVDSEVILELPSKNKFYNGATDIVLKPMTFENEKNVIANMKKDIDPINTLLADCIKGVNISDLLIFDKVYVLMRLRQLSYGETYEFNIDCPKCGRESHVSMSLQDLIVNQIPDDLTDPREITLPVSKKKVKVRFPRVRDEHYLMTPELINNNLYKMIDSVENISDILIINQFIKKLPLRDVKAIIKEINRPDLGLDPRLLFECPKCNKSTEVSIPITANFFSVS
jgi:transcription elongation factor Elf1